MSVGLLDVNVLLALFDPCHVHHEPAQHWLSTEGRKGWATCPVTENGFVRVASQPSYPSSPGGVPVVRRLLSEFCRARSHAFWPDAISLRDPEIFRVDATVAPNHLTDIYLLGLAVHQGGRLITFDRRVPLSAVRGGDKAIRVLA